MGLLGKYAKSGENSDSGPLRLLDKQDSRRKNQTAREITEGVTRRSKVALAQSQGLSRGAGREQAAEV